MKNTDETIKVFIEEINQDELMSKKLKKVCTTLNYIDHLLILAFIFTGYVLISVFASLIGIPIDITSSAVGLKMCTLTPGIKKYKSIIRKERKIMVK